METGYRRKLVWLRVPVKLGALPNSKRMRARMDMCSGGILGLTGGACTYMLWGMPVACVCVLEKTNAEAKLSDVDLFSCAVTFNVRTHWGYICTQIYEMHVYVS